MPTATIIGGGFAGMTVALCLRSRGITPTIFELRDEAYTSGGSIALAPNALRVLDHIGAFEKIRTQGYNYEELGFINGSGVTLGSFLNGSQKVYNYQAVRIHRTVVRDELRRLCGQRDIPIKYGMKCEEVSETSGHGVVVRFKSGESVSSDYLIGADGIHSTVRHYIAPNSEAPRFSGLMGIMGAMDADDLRDADRQFHLPTMLFGSSGSFAIMPSSYDGQEIGYFATIEAEDRSRKEWDELGSDKGALHEMLMTRFCAPQSEWPAYVQALCARTPTETLTSWPFYSAPALSSWVSDSARVFLIGDAAHAIPPTGGQGAAMALEDAETLAYTLAESLVPLAENDEPQRLRKLGSAWNAHRHARVGRVLAFTTKNGALRKSSAHFYEQAAKEWLMWAMFKWTGPEAGMQWMYEYSATSVRAELV